MLLNCMMPKDYRPYLDAMETENAIKILKDFFQINLAKELDLRRVTAPLFVKAGTGINDNLNGIEKPVAFNIKDMDDTPAEIVQSLAKWKRMALAQLQIDPGHGIYTDMNAIRPDEYLDNLHSLYVDQWDWEKVLTGDQRNLESLRSLVNKIYQVMRKTEFYIHAHYAEIAPILPEEITFIHTLELEQRYPTLSPGEREDEICKEYRAVFIIGIGAPLTQGQPHDNRAPDYDDWMTPTELGPGLNGDILVWYPLLEKAVELSSMGIRVDAATLEKQLEMTKTTERQKLLFHRKLLNEELPLTVGGGIGQSRLCMFHLRKAHIGEVQASVWPDEMIEQCQKNNIFFL